MNNQNSTEGGNSSSFKSRLLTLLKAKRMSQTEFCNYIGVSSTYIGSMRKSMPPARLKKVYELFPDLNRDWLLYGEGEMFVAAQGNGQFNSEYIVPLLPVEAYAGNLQDWSDGVRLEDCDRIVSPVPGADFAIKVTGNSMEPEIYGGSTLFIKKINDRAFIPWGNPLVVDSENGVLVKMLYPAAEEGVPVSPRPRYIEARSYNRDYPPFLIPSESIFGLYRILTITRDYSTL